jgi:hypothetical protein
VRKNR